MGKILFDNVNGYQLKTGHLRLTPKAEGRGNREQRTGTPATVIIIDEKSIQIDFPLFSCLVFMY
jgi:hypothetical protein